MWAEKPISHGTASATVRSGALALPAGARTNADILIDIGVIPKFTGCVDSVQRQWTGNAIEPTRPA